MCIVPLNTLLNVLSYFHYGDSDGEQDELMRAIALSLGEDIAEATTSSISSRGSNSNTTSKPPRQPNELEAGKNDLQRPR